MEEWFGSGGCIISIDRPTFVEEDVTMRALQMRWQTLEA